MNFDMEKARNLIRIFAELDEQNQDALLVEASVMHVKQNISNNIRKKGEAITEQSVDAAMDEYLDVINFTMDRWDDMSPNHHAAIAILLNEMSKGKLTREEYIDFVLKTRQLSISEYIETYIPGADFEEAKKIYKSLRQNM